MCPCRPAANYSKLVHRALLVRQCVLGDQQQTTVSLYTEQCLSGNVSYRPAANYSKLVHRALLVRQCVLGDQQQTTVSLYTEHCLSGNVSLSTSSKLQQACTQSIACQAMCPGRPAANYSKLAHRALLVRQCVLVDQQQTTVSLYTEQCLSGNVSLSTSSKLQ